MKIRHYIFFILLIGIASCSSPQKLYEKGKYYKAFDSVLGDIKGSKKKRKDVLLLNKSFSKIIDEARDKMYVLEDGYEVSDLEYNFEQYDEVDTRYVKARSYINDDNEIKYEGLKSEKNRHLNDAYAEGKSLLEYFTESNQKLDARNAYYHFELVNDYGTGYEDIDQMLYESKEAATLIYHIETDLDFDYSYQWDIDRKFDDLEGESGFVKIIYDNNNVQNADCFIELDFSKLDVDEKERETSQNFTKEVVDGYTTKTDTSGNTIQVPKYINVSGQVRSISITKEISWSVNIKIVKSSINCDLRQKRYRANLEDKVEIFEISGDERAIPSEFINNSNTRLKDTDDMVDDLIEDLYIQIRRYFY